MRLELTPDQVMIRTEAVRFLQDRASSEAVRRIIDSGAGSDAGLWIAAAQELGWCGMTIPEAYGGLGLGMVELVILLEATGQRLACLPLFATTCLAVPLLLGAASEEAKQRLLPEIAAGTLSATVAYPGLGTDRPMEACTVAAARTDDGYVLSGSVEHVIDLASADLILVPAICEGALALFVVTPADGVVIEPLETLDPTRLVARLILPDLVLRPQSRIDAGGLSEDAIDMALAHAELGLAAEQVGSAQEALDMTLSYLSSRVQFGRTIASFQAVKHRCAQLAVAISEARALVYGAAASFSGDVFGRAEIAGARVAAGDIQYRSAEEAIQLHGGVGFTWEYDAHLYFKRAQMNAAIFGLQEGRLERIAAELLDGGRQS